MSTDSEHWQWLDEDPFEKAPQSNGEAAAKSDSSSSDPTASQEELKEWKAVANSYRLARVNDLDLCQWVDEDPFSTPARPQSNGNGAHVAATIASHTEPAEARQDLPIRKRPMGIAPISDPRAHIIELANQAQTLCSHFYGSLKTSFSNSYKSMRYHFFGVFSADGEDRLSMVRGWERLLEQTVKRRRSRAS